MRSTALLLGLCASACGAPDAARSAPDAGTPVPDAAPDAEPPAGNPLADLPLLVPGRFSRAITSFDRGGGNDDGFAGTWSDLDVDANGEHVILDARGPGTLTTLWFTGPSEGGSPLGLGRVRFYFDDASDPAIDLDDSALFDGKHPPFLAPLVFDNHESTGGFASFVPLAYAERLRVTTAARARFYAAYYEAAPPDTPLASWQPGNAAPDTLVARFDSAALPSTLAPVTVAPDTTGSGAGEIDLVRVVPTSMPDEATLRAARIRIWWDGSIVPAVDCPLGMFFGDALGQATVHAVGLYVDGGAFENRFPMPFSDGYRIEVTGLTGTLSLAVGPARTDAAASARLHAAFHEQDPTSDLDDFEYLSASGAGRLFATVLRVEPGDPLVKRWWEGDLRSSTNGKHDPDIHGTGHEDDHFGGWSNTFFSAPFTLPANGEPAFETLDTNGQINGNVSLYRVFPGIDFFDGIRHSVEHGTGNSVIATTYAATTFYYTDAAWHAQETDSVDASDDGSRGAHAYQASGETTAELLNNAYEGRESGGVVAMSHRSHTGPASFTVATDPDNAGVLLSRSFDQSRGGQSARVLVDGSPVTTWYTPERNPVMRWGEREIFLPRSVTRGKSTLAITVEPDADAPPWDVARYRVVTLRHAP